MLRDILGFFGFLALVFASIAALWMGLKIHGDQSPLNNYQTNLTKDLFVQKSKLWAKMSGKQHWLEIFFDPAATQKGAWMVSNKPAIPADKAVSKEAAEIIPVSDYLKESADRNDKRVVFFSVKNAKALPSLATLFESNEYWKSTIFCSRDDGTLKDLRALKPRWTYCSGEVFLTRLLGFASLGLERLLTIDADVIYLHLDNVTPTPTFNAIIELAQKHKKLVFIGPTDKPIEGFEPNGWIIVQ